MARSRPIVRLLAEPQTGSGKAQIVEKPSQLKHILWAASRGELGRRNVAIIWMLFGSGLRVNEVAQLLKTIHNNLEDFLHSGSIFTMPSERLTKAIHV